MHTAHLVLAALVCALIAAVSVGFVSRYVDRGRVQRFALREALVVTPGNGDQIIRYLATTRRWRSAGLLIGGAAFAVWSLAGGRFSLNGGALFVGWFAGALAAEWRVSTDITGPRRAAHLVPRQRSDFLSPAARAIPRILIVVVSVVAGLDIVGGLVNGHSVWSHVIPAVVVVAVGLPIVSVVQQHALSRPQPLLPPDEIAADTAIRRRSIRVLAGSAVAGSGIPAGVLVGALHVAYPALDSGTTNGLGAVLGLAAVIAGWTIGRAPQRASTMAQSTPTLATP